MNNTKTGFTLVELLIVIAILAVLSTAVVLILNPAELIKQSRDSTRISDLAALNSAIAYFASDTAQNTSAWPTAASTKCTVGTTKPGAAAAGGCANVASTATDGTGWVNLDFRLIAGGSPLSKLPIDPINNAAGCPGTPAGCFYAFTVSASNGKYKIWANMESAKYNSAGNSEVETAAKDGGNVDSWYEVGSDLTL